MTTKTTLIIMLDGINCDEYTNACMRISSHGVLQVYRGNWEKGLLHVYAGGCWKEAYYERANKKGR